MCGSTSSPATRPGGHRRAGRSNRRRTRQFWSSNALIHAEVSIGFATIEALEEALPPDLHRREHLPDEAAFLAGKAFMRYREAGGVRRSPLPDFYIGAHAAVAGYRVLTRDQTRYRTYYPTVELIAPDA